MSIRREFAGFGLILGLILAGFFSEALIGGKVLSSADSLFVSASFRECGGVDCEPNNRLLMDPVIQFQPWLEFNRAMFRRGRLPLWNSHAGAGTPHLANAQSAPFDPFHLFAYLGMLPDALAWIMAARLWIAGLGMFLLAKSWGLGAWGRWFAGLTFPFCGFLIVWLMFPVTSAAIWMPWVFLATDRVLDRCEPRGIGLLALAVGITLLGGHIQTSAHVLLADGLYVVWRVFPSRLVRLPDSLRVSSGWVAGIVLGLLLGAVTIVPLAVYLGKSPVWEDRQLESPSPLAITRPRLLDTICTAVPYAFGSQRRGHPNLARAVGVHNLNESAGGYAGLATLLWLAPNAWLARKRQTRVNFLIVLAGFGFLGAFGFAPVANLLRAAPILNVMDQRRLTLWVAFSLVLLGGIGLDHLNLSWPVRTSRYWVSLWIATAAGLLLAAVCVPLAEPRLRSVATQHYARSVAAIEGADPAIYRARAERQVESTMRFLPRLLGFTGLELATLAGLAAFSTRGRWTQASLLGLTLVELLTFGFGLNPAIAREDDRPETAVVRSLRRDVGTSGRMLGIGEEWPPNVAMRYGLADIRNYDSVELSRSLAWFAPLYEPSRNARSSRRMITWEGVIRSRDLLYESGVVAVVSATPPPEGLSEDVERVGSVWVTGLDAAPKIGTLSGRDLKVLKDNNGLIDLVLNRPETDTVIVRETYDPGWRAELDGRPIPIDVYRDVFMSVRVERGSHRLLLMYDPPEVRVALTASALGFGLIVFLLLGFLPVRPVRFLAKGLGRPVAFGLESYLQPVPDISTG